MVEGLRALRRKFKVTIPRAVERHLKQAMEVFADKVVASAESFVPEKEGDLKNSIGWVWGTNIPSGAISLGGVSPGGNDRLVITIFAGDESTMVSVRPDSDFKLQNALMQEFGTENMPANPFFFVSYRLNKRGGLSGMTRAMKRGIKEGSR